MGQMVRAVFNFSKCFLIRNARYNKVYNLLRLLKLSRGLRQAQPPIITISYLLINAFQCLLVTAQRPHHVLFQTKRHLGKFCFQIHEFGSDIIKK